MTIRISGLPSDGIRYRGEGVVRSGELGYLHTFSRGPAPDLDSATNQHSDQCMAPGLACLHYELWWMGRRGAVAVLSGSGPGCGGSGPGDGAAHQPRARLRTLNSSTKPLTNRQNGRLYKSISR
jgi:hypothetical protein